MCYEIKTEQIATHVLQTEKKEKRTYIYYRQKRQERKRYIYYRRKRGYGQSKLAERSTEKLESVSVCNHCVECAPGDTCRLKQILNLTPVLTFLIPLCPRFFLFFSTLPLQEIDPIG